MDLNKVMLIGNLTRDPETRSTASGQTVTTFGMATNRAWTDSSGQRQEKVEFHNIVTWGKLAEICSQYLAKGRRIYLEGRLQTREWTGDDSVRRFRTEIVGDNMIILDRKSAPDAAPPGQGSASPAERSEVGRADEESKPPSETQGEPGAGEDIKVEQIPF